MCASCANTRHALRSAAILLALHGDRSVRITCEYTSCPEVNCDNVSTPRIPQCACCNHHRPWWSPQRESRTVYRWLVLDVECLRNRRLSIRLVQGLVRPHVPAHDGSAKIAINTDHALVKTTIRIQLGGDMKDKEGSVARYRKPNKDEEARYNTFIWEAVSK